MASVLLRLTASPQLKVTEADELRSRLGGLGRVLSAISDLDLAATVTTVELEQPAPSDALASVARILRPLSAERSFQIEFLSEDPATLPKAAELPALAKLVEEELAAPALADIRQTTVGVWSKERPFGWGRRGIDVGDRAGKADVDASTCMGAALVFGAPTVVYKIRLEELPNEGLQRACAAVGGPKSGFADVGAYPATSAADGCSVAVVELGDESKAPLHRVLDVMALECARYGGRLGTAAFLSFVPLQVLLDTLRARTGLDAKSAQVIETHLPVRERAGEGGRR